MVSLIDPNIQVTANHAVNAEPEVKRPRVELTPEQRKRIEENRKKALEIRNRLDKNNKDASSYKPEQVILTPAMKEQLKKKEDRKPEQVTRKRDYIDYDFSTMTDTYGGFMEDTGGGEETSKSLEDWKERQKAQHVVRDLPPPLDISTAPKCYECDSLEIDPNLYDNFNHTRVCRRCAKEKPEKYSLLTKTECKEDYLLTEPELQDTNLLSRIEKPNPHGYSRMQLFLRLQVEKFAAKKWGSLENLDKEWERREEMRLKRKDKKYKDKLKEMRRKTRAEEFTRKLRNGKSINDKHVHDWAQPMPFERDGMKFVKKRCIDCGTEVEELQL